MSSEETPWTRGDLRIDRAALAEVERAAIAGYGVEEEVCGLLAGPAADPLLCDRAIPIESLARFLHERDPLRYPQTARSFFAFQERALESAIRDGKKREHPVKVLYHSHLDVGAYLSGMDQAMLSRGGMPATPDGPALLGNGPPWPIAFLVTSVRIPAGATSPYVDEHRLFVWAGDAFVPSSFSVV